MNTFETNINVKTGLPFTREEMLAYYKDIRDRERNSYIDVQDVEGTAPNLYRELKKRRCLKLYKLKVGQIVKLMHNFNPSRECDSTMEFAKVIEVQKNGLSYLVRRVEGKEVKIYDDGMGHTKWSTEIIDRHPRNVCQEHKDLYAPTFIMTGNGHVKVVEEDPQKSTYEIQKKRKYEMWHPWVPTITDHYSF